MIHELLPTSYVRHLSLPVLGPVLDDFDDWLVLHGYQFNTRQSYLLRCSAIDTYLHKRRQHSLSALTPESLRKCSQYFRHRPGGVSNTVGCLQRFLQSQQILTVPKPPAVDASFDVPVADYRRYLREVRGLSPITIEQHEHTIWQLLHYQRDRDCAFRLADFTQANVERFITYAGNRYGRSTLQHVTSHVRGFLRFLALRSEVRPGLDRQIDTPRVYRQEHLPRALPWETVSAFLDSIDRECVGGLRDYVFFLLIATYGLRGCDIASLRLDDIDWRSGEIHINHNSV